MITYKLNTANGIMCDKVCKDIHKYLQKYKQENQNKTDLLLVIQVRGITKDDTSHILKLEYKNPES